MADQNEIALELFIKADKAKMTLGDLEKGYEFLSDQIKETDRSTEAGHAFSHKSPALRKV